MRYVVRYVLSILACGLILGFGVTTVGASSVESISTRGSVNSTGRVVGPSLELHGEFASGLARLQVEPTLATVVPPVVNEICGANNDEIVLQPQVGVEVDFDTTWIGGSRTIRYAPLTGYYIDTESGYAEFMYVDITPCYATIVPPVVNETCGANNDEIVLQPQVGAELDFDTTWIGGTRTIRYAPLPGYTIDSPSGYAEFMYVDITPCYATIVPPVVNEICGANNDEVLLQPQVGAELDFDTTWIGGARTIRYAPLPGYTIDSPSGYAEFMYVDEGPCLVTIPEILSTEVCQANNDFIDLSNLPTGVYVSNDTGWVDGWRTITFAAEPGYVLDGSFEVGFNDSNNDCSVLVVPPAMTEVCGPNNDVVSFPEQPEGILPPDDTGWSDNIRIITYTADEGFLIDNPREYEFHDSASPCLTAPIEPTQSAICGPNNDAITIPAQPEGVALATDSMWEANSRTITFKATGDYVIEGQSIFEFTDENIPCSTETPVPTPTPVVEPTATPAVTPVPSPDPTAAVKPSMPTATSTVQVNALPNTGSGYTHTSGMLLLVALGILLSAFPIMSRLRR